MGNFGNFGVCTSKGWIRQNITRGGAYYLFSLRPCYPFRTAQEAQDELGEWLERIELSANIIARPTVAVAAK